jgi:hypothetical protein
MLTEKQKEDQLAAALRMSNMYKDSRYTARERAGDHAFSYDANEWQREYWLGVCEHLEKINKGEQA